MTTPPPPPGQPPYPPPSPYLGEPPPSPYLGGPPPYPYAGAPSSPYEPPPRTTSGWAIAALVFGIIGGVLLSVIFGIIALNKTRGGRQAGRGMAIAGLVLSALWTVLIAVAVVLVVATTKDNVNATDVAVGDCLTEIPDSPRIYSLNRVTCDKPHKGEVYAVLNMPSGDYPGQSAIDDFQNKCGPALQTYSPTAMEDPAIGVYVLYPTPETWAHGDRAVACIATSDTPRTGSVKR